MVLPGRKETTDLLDIPAVLVRMGYPVDKANLGLQDIKGGPVPRGILDYPETQVNPDNQDYVDTQVHQDYQVKPALPEFQDWQVKLDL